VINSDNGPENSGSRSQWLKRLVHFSADADVIVKLAYYPPYHSKYNPIERVFGVLENYWNGNPLRSIDIALGFAKTMTYNGVSPTATLVKPSYAKGVKLTNFNRCIYEKALRRMSGLAKWFITILPARAKMVAGLMG